MIQIRAGWRALACTAIAASLVLAVYGCPKKHPQEPVAPPNAGGERGVIVEIKPAGTYPNPDPFKCELFEGADPTKKGIDHVRWHNGSGVTVKLHFIAGWPFMGPQQDIDIPVDGTSAWFTLNFATPNTSYSYHIDGVPTSESGPPGDPTISDGP